MESAEQPAASAEDAVEHDGPPVESAECLVESAVTVITSMSAAELEAFFDDFCRVLDVDGFDAVSCLGAAPCGLGCRLAFLFRTIIVSVSFDFCLLVVLVNALKFIFF